MSGMSSRLRHDLRGAAVNISGFHSELVISAGELREELAPLMANLPEAAQARFSQLIDDDLIALLGFLGTSIEQLENVLANSDDSSSNGEGEGEGEGGDG